MFEIFFNTKNLKIIEKIESRKIWKIYKAINNVLNTIVFLNFKSNRSKFIIIIT